MDDRFKDFIHRAWNDHGSDPGALADRLPNGVSLVDSEDQVPEMAQLITHVLGEHLGRWQEGIQLLHQLRQLSLLQPRSAGDRAVQWSIVSLELASGQRSDARELPVSDQIRAFATAAAALSEQGTTERATSYFKAALELAQASLPAEDPANRALAVMGNNLACTLEEKASRKSEQTELMILAARTARKYWGIAGTWLQVERAEYRLSRSYLQAGDLRRAREHARLCLEICGKNDAPALELFFGYEALALAERAAGGGEAYTRAREQARACFEQLGEDEQKWCLTSLKALELS